MTDDEIKALAMRALTGTFTEHRDLLLRVGPAAVSAGYSSKSIEAALREAHERGVQEEREMKNDPMVVDHERWLDERNAGAASLALAILGDDGRGLMSPGPCADLEAAWRRLKGERDAAYTAGMKRAADKVDYETDCWADAGMLNVPALRGLAADIRAAIKGGPQE